MQLQSWPDDQRAFAAALLHRDAPTPAGVVTGGSARAAERFGIYRNNVMVGLIDALQAAFPVSTRLVGEEFFRAMARVHVTQQLPATAALAEYGAGLPAFIEQFAPAAILPYLADVARLEFAWTRAYGAADAEPLEPAQLAGLSAEELLYARFFLHPASQLLCSEHPVAALWRSHQQDEVAPLSERWKAECVLVTRPFADVQVHTITSGEYAFLLALQTGADVESASRVALGKQADFAPGAGLSTALAAGAFSGFARATTRRKQRR